MHIIMPQCTLVYGLRLTGLDFVRLYTEQYLALIKEDPNIAADPQQIEHLLSYGDFVCLDHIKDCFKTQGHEKVVQLWIDFDNYCDPKDVEYDGMISCIIGIKVSRARGHYSGGLKVPVIEESIKIAWEKFIKDNPKLQHENPNMFVHLNLR
jgi:hypothetical protein